MSSAANRREPPGSIPAGMGARAWTAIGVVAIFVLTFAAYWPVLTGGWVWDDHSEILSSPVVRDPAGLGMIWRGEGTLDYFPLKTTVQWLQWRWWGQNTTGYHVTNVALHALSSVLLWRVLQQLGLSAVAAAASGLLFAVHPLCVESVAWIAELKNALSLPPLLLSLSAYLGFTENGRRRNYVCALAWYVIAALCKSSVVMLPMFLLVYHAWRRDGANGKQAWRNVLVALLPFFATSLLFGVIAIAFQHHRAIGTWELPVATPLERTGRAAAMLGFYGLKSLLPHNLLPMYPREAVSASPVIQVGIWLALAAVVVVGIRSWNSWGRHVLLALAWFSLHLLPVLGFVDMAYFYLGWVADHFAYISLAGLVGIVGVAWERSRARKRGPRALASALALTAVGAGWVLTRQHAAHFRSEEALWRYTLAKNPQAWIGHNNLAFALSGDGKFAEALAHATEAMRLKPDYTDAHLTRAEALLGLGRLDEARAAAAAADKLLPKPPAVLHEKLGSALLRAGRVAEARQHLATAADSDPNLPQAQKDLAVALYFQGQTAEAIRHYERGLALAPDADTHANCGLAYVQLQQMPAATRHFEAALRLDPNNLTAHYNFGIALAKAGRAAEARAHFERVLALKPDHAEAYYHIGELLLAAGQPGAAREAFQTALKIKPGLAEARARLHLLERGALQP